jgi:hypothetical protein
MRQRLTDIFAALAGASVLTLAMLAGIDHLAQQAPAAAASPAWAGYYVASILV